jgi:hypothetical protein
MLLGCIFGLIKLYKGERLLYKKCYLGKGTKFIVISFISTFKSPEYLIEHVILFITFATIEFSFSKWFDFFFTFPASINDEPSFIWFYNPDSSPLEKAPFESLTFSYYLSTLDTISNRA